MKYEYFLPRVNKSIRNYGKEGQGNKEYEESNSIIILCNSMIMRRACNCEIQ